MSAEETAVVKPWVDEKLALGDVRGSNSSAGRPVDMRLSN